MTNEEYMLNGLKYDNLIIRKEVEDFNFNLSIFILCYALLHVFPINLVLGEISSATTIIAIAVSISIALIEIYYFLRMFRNVMKLDFLFMGQFIRDAYSVGRFVVRPSRKKIIVNTFVENNKYLDVRDLNKKFINMYYNKLTEKERGNVVVDDMWQSVLKQYYKVTK